MSTKVSFTSSAIFSRTMSNKADFEVDDALTAPVGVGDLVYEHELHDATGCSSAMSAS